MSQSMTQSSKSCSSRHGGFSMIVLACIAITASGGCATNYSPRADLSTVETIGVAVPPGAGEPAGAQDVFQLYAIGEDRLATSAAGAGAGAAAGTAAGIGAGAIIGCAGLGPLAFPCWGVMAAAGAVTGGASGAIAGAVVDPDDPIDAAPVHLYAVNQILPDLIREHLSSEILETRALQTVRSEQTPIEFVPASWDGARYAAVEQVITDRPATGVYLVLSAMNVSLKGKAKEDPKISLSIGMQWSVTRYNQETQKDEIWDAWPADYESKKFRLSKWLDNDAALLKAEMDKGIQQTLDSSFSKLPQMARR